MGLVRIDPFQPFALTAPPLLHTLSSESTARHLNEREDSGMKKGLLFCVCVLSVVMVFSPGWAKEPTIKIGINAPLTGDIPKVGEGTKFAAQLWLEDIKAAGGITAGKKKYPVELILEDNESKAESAVKVATKMITEDDVLVMVGPQASKQAVPAGGIANNYKTPMITPWSTNPDTTKNRPYVFRACFLDPFQGPVVANFISKEFKFTKAAVLYDVASDYPKGLAEYFKKAWEDKHGKGSVVAYESFTTKDTDFSSQLTKIVNSGAQVLFTPQYYNEVALIVQQAHQLGWKKPIVGSDSWGSAETVKLCGKDCYGSFFSTHYAAAGATGATKAFINRYKAKYGYVPDDVAALTWDSMLLVQKAIQDTGGLTGDVKKDREKVRIALSQVKKFKGITGEMTFSGTGDPVKCAVIVKISNTGEFTFYQSVCP
jgi:branched-chain amino acid transport system substrate-binding protein